MAKDHTRLPRVTRISASELIIPEKELDPQFTKLIKQEHAAQITSGVSRLDQRQITRGFFKRVSGKPLLVQDEINEQHLSLISDRIRKGYRPRIHVYWAEMISGRRTYVAPDDQITLEAYRSLNIDFVPVQILKPKKERIVESVITFRGMKSNSYSGYISADRNLYRAFYEPSSDVDEIVNFVQEKCVETLNYIKEFHEDGGDVHYHQMLYASVRRFLRCIQSIKILTDSGNADHAFGMLRLAYEGLLIFYLDWLSPELMGSAIQLVSASQRIVIRGGEGSEKIRDPKEILGSLADLISDVSQKAQISPLGMEFYRLAYPSLSFVVHQDYGELDLDGDGFSDEIGNEKWQLEALAKWVNVISAEFLFRVRDDIGMRLS